MSATVSATLRRGTNTFTFLLAATGAVVPFARCYLEFCVRGLHLRLLHVIQNEGRGLERGATDLRGNSTVKQEAMKEHA